MPSTYTNQIPRPIKEWRKNIEKEFGIVSDSKRKHGKPTYIEKKRREVKTSNGKLFKIRLSL